LTFTYDTVAPAVTEALINNNIGSSGQNVTADGALTGSGDPNTLVTLSENGTTLGTATANASGVWNYTASSLTAGAHTIVASETDTAGNTGSASLTFTYSPPAVTVKLVADTGSSSTDGLTSNDALTGTAGANATVTLKEGTTTLGTTTANASGVWNYTPASLAQGAHTISATSGGNSASVTFTYDSVAPTPVFTQTPPATGVYRLFRIGFVRAVEKRGKT
jgi:VCBS repeat-containing protein